VLPTCIAGIHEFWRNHRKPLSSRDHGKSARRKRH
jgi:hypothetical protein